MFNIFPQYGSPGDSISPEELTGKSNNVYPTWTWSTGIKDADGKDISVSDLITKYNALLGENKILREELESIEEDGTEEHNKAIKLREENVELKKLLIDTKNGNKYWEDICKMKTDHIYDLMKEVNGLRHLKEENVRVYETMNTQTDTMGKLMERIDKLEKENAALLNKGGLTYKDAQIQIIHNDYIKCAEERDEYKHQLNAANKEIDQLKEENADLMEILSKYRDGYQGSCYACEPVGELNQKLELQIKAYQKIVEGAYETIENLKEINFKLSKKVNDETVEYPIHWGGYDGAASAYPEQYSEWLNIQRDKAISEKITTEKSWEEAASDLALRVVKLEKKVEELTLVKIQINPPNISTSSHGLNIKGTI